MAIEWWVVLATVAGPVIAVQTQKWIERATENQNRKRLIFQVMMANRATRLSDDHVKAVNMIDLAFLPMQKRIVPCSPRGNRYSVNSREE
jgi:hypothetical protein